MSLAYSLPDDIETLKRLVLARDAELARAEGLSGSYCASAVEKMRRELYGQRSERKVCNR